MKINHTISLRFLLCIVLASLILASCNNSSSWVSVNQAYTQASQIADMESPSTKGDNSNQEEERFPALATYPGDGQKVKALKTNSQEHFNRVLDWKSREGHIVHRLYQRPDSATRATLYDSAGVAYDLPVYIFPHTSWEEIATYPPKKLSFYLHVKLPAKGSPGSLVISQGGLQGGGKRSTRPSKKQKMDAAVADLGELGELPQDLLGVIFSYVGSKEMSKVRQLNKAFYKEITGYQEPKRGATHKPAPSSLANEAVVSTCNRRKLEFRRSQVELSPETIPSFPFYRLLGDVENMPSPFWVYLKDTCIHTLRFFSIRIDDLEAIRLAQALKKSRVKILEVNSNSMSVDGAAAFAKNLRETLVEEVIFNNNEHTIAYLPAVEFAKNLQGTRIKKINLSHNYIIPSSAAEIAKSLQLTSVRAVSLTNNDLGNMGAIGFARNLQGTSVEEVDLSNNDIEDSGIAEFAQSLQVTSVKEINLSDNRISGLGAAAFAKNLQGTNVEKVYLADNEIGSGAAAFAKNLQGTQVKMVDLTRNQIEAPDAVAFAKSLQGTCIKYVCLSGNEIRNSGAKGFAESLEGTSIEIVDLSCNKIENLGAADFAKNLQGKSVKEVNLSNNLISADGAADFAKNLQGTSVTKVNLGGNKIEDSVAAAFAKNLQGTSVNKVNLSDNLISADGAAAFAKNLQGTKVKEVDLSRNQIGDEMKALLRNEYPHIEWHF